MVNLVRSKKRTVFLIVTIIAIPIILFAHYLVEYNMKNGIVICYHNIVPDYELKNITIKEKDYIKLFKDMLNDSEEQYREKNPQLSLSDRKVGSYISFSLSSRNDKIIYNLRGPDLYVYTYHNSDTSVSEIVIYNTPKKYYEKWVEYCLNN